MLAMTEARQYWPGRADWERGPDPRREPESYEQDPDDGEEKP